MDKDIVAAQEEAQEARKQVEKAHQEQKDLQAQHEELNLEFEEVELAYKEETKQLSAFDDELKALEKAKNAKEEEITSLSEDEVQYAAEIDRLTKDVERAAGVLKQLMATHSWIPDEKAYVAFGVARMSLMARKQSLRRRGRPIRFRERTDGRDQEATLRIAGSAECAEEEGQPESDGLDRQVRCACPRCRSLTPGSLEKKQSELIKMHEQVVKDRSKIEETIAKLDNYKREALTKTWEEVDKNFGLIFGDLLPGNFSKLEPPEGMDITEGLEVKVRLGKVWKQSLTELSGGQRSVATPLGFGSTKFTANRSLIALSLIMSLLQYKPAPMYILDEVDAALDLSHTQHIGQLFRNRFKGSQFIVVSRPFSSRSVTEKRRRRSRSRKGSSPTPTSSSRPSSRTGRAW
jgi:structural maintenance of chromosome 2